MEKTETNKIINKITTFRQSFLIKRDTIDEWHKVLKDYDYKDVDAIKMESELTTRKIKQAETDSYKEIDIMTKNKGRRPTTEGVYSCPRGQQN